MSSNRFGLLSGAAPQENAAASANAAKNRRKKERQKQKKAAEGGEPPIQEPVAPAPAQASSIKDTKPGKVKTAESLKDELLSDSQSNDCWPVWDGWLRQVRAQRVNARPSYILSLYR